MERPSTSKPRGICKYYETPRGCFAGKGCKFLHGQDEKFTPYDKNKICRYYRSGPSPPPSLASDTELLTDNLRAGYCKRGDRCWFLHVDGSEEPSPPGSDAECIVCYEKPVTYGLMGASETAICESSLSNDCLLDGCSHVLCVQVRITPPQQSWLLFQYLTSTPPHSAFGNGVIRATEATMRKPPTSLVLTVGSLPSS
jgi:hypothetical protein